jgi:sporulation protein YabP
MEEKNFRPEVRPLSSSETPPAVGLAPHSLQIVNREQVRIQGVIAVESFDDQEIIVETDMGTLTLRGEELHIKQLDLESGRFAVDGYISMCTYSTPRQRLGRTQKGKGFLERLLR